MPRRESADLVTAELDYGWPVGPQMAGLQYGRVRAPSVVQDLVFVGSEDHIELPSRRQEVVEVGWIFFVPEDGRNALITAVLKKIQELRLWSAASCQLVLPGAAVAIPGRLYEQEIDALLVKLLPPAVLIQEQDLPLVGERPCRKVVKNHAYCEVHSTGRYVRIVKRFERKRTTSLGETEGSVRAANRASEAILMPTVPLAYLRKAPLAEVPDGLPEVRNSPHQTRLRRILLRARTSVIWRLARASSRIFAADRLLPFAK